MEQTAIPKIKAKHVMTTTMGECSVALVYQAGSDTANIILQPYFPTYAEGSEPRVKATALREFEAGLIRLKAANYDVDLPPGLTDTPAYVVIQLPKGAPLTRDTIEGITSAMAGEFKPLEEKLVKNVYNDKFTTTQAALVGAANDLRGYHARGTLHMLNCGEDDVRRRLNTALGQAHLISEKRATGAN